MSTKEYYTLVEYGDTVYMVASGVFLSYSEMQRLYDKLGKTLEQLTLSDNGLSARRIEAARQLDRILHEADIFAPSRREVSKTRKCVYFLRERLNDGLCKIGYTNGLLSTRIRNIAKLHGLPVAERSLWLEHVALVIKTPEASHLEALIHDRFAPYRKHGEWFDLQPEHWNYLHSFVRA